MPAAHSGSRYVRAQVRSSGPPVMPASTRPRSGHRSAGSRQDHFDDRHGVPLPGITKDRRAGRVAGDHQDLHALVDKMIKTLQGVLPNAGDLLLAVRRTGGIPQIDDVFMRQLINDRAGHGESTESRIKDADRRFGVGRHGWSAYASR